MRHEKNYGENGRGVPAEEERSEKVSTRPFRTGVILGRGSVKIGRIGKQPPTTSKARRFYDWGYVPVLSASHWLCVLALPLVISTCERLVAQNPHPASNVPFVGCKSDGQAGPLPSPKSTAKAIALSSELADQLTYYKAENGFGMVAPRGWYCFSTYGSNGGSLFVSPEPINNKELFTSDWKGFLGSAIQVSVSVGGTSGRFA
jgi:hypothetical protein